MKPRFFHFEGFHRKHKVFIVHSKGDFINDKTRNIIQKAFLAEKNKINCPDDEYGTHVPSLGDINQAIWEASYETMPHLIKSLTRITDGNYTIKI